MSILKKIDIISPLKRRHKYNYYVVMSELKNMWFRFKRSRGGE